MINFNKDFLAGTVVGFGAGIFSRELTKSVGGWRSAGRAVIRSAMLSYDKALESVSYVKETLEDLTAEARAEVAARRQEGDEEAQPEKEPKEEKEVPEEKLQEAV